MIMTSHACPIITFRSVIDPRLSSTSYLKLSVSKYSGLSLHEQLMEVAFGSLTPECNRWNLDTHELHS
jgi:hypothetical protein